MTQILLTIVLLFSLSISYQVDSIALKERVAKTGSMLPTIPFNAKLLVDEAYYAAKNPRRFDIVEVRRSFSNPDLSERSMDVVVRVIGLPGELIALRGGSIYIDGRKIKEPFDVRQCPSKIDEMFPCGEMSAMKIPAGEYFMLADNRAESEDSRLWSPRTIPKSAVLGKVIKVELPSSAVQQALEADSP